MLKKGLFKSIKGYIYFRKQIAGKRYCLPVYTKHERTANNLVPTLEAQVIKSHYSIGQDKLHPITLTELRNKFLNSNPDWSKHTVSAYDYSLNQYISLGKTLAGKKSETKKFINRHVRSAINWGISEGYDVIRFMPKGDCNSSPRCRIASQDEITLLLKTKGKFGDFIRFIYFTGARRSEACSVDLANLNKRDGYIDVWGKSGHRLLRITKQAMKCIHTFDYTPRATTRRFKRLTTRLNIPDLTLHDLRRTFGTEYLRRGGTMAKLSVLLGHNSIRTTELHYVFLKVRDIKDFKL